MLPHLTLWDFREDGAWRKRGLEHNGGETHSKNQTKSEFSDGTTCISRHLLIKTIKLQSQGKDLKETRNKRQIIKDQNQT